MTTTQCQDQGRAIVRVAFTAATLTSLNALHLTSNGTALTYSFSDNGQLLTAKAGGTTVFTVQLSDTANGTYTFKLLDNLDHASGNAKNDLALTFGFTATDSDGDTTAPAQLHRSCDRRRAGGRRGRHARRGRGRSPERDVTEHLRPAGRRPAEHRLELRRSRWRECCQPFRCRSSTRRLRTSSRGARCSIIIW